MFNALWPWSTTNLLDFPFLLNRMLSLPDVFWKGANSFLSEERSRSADELSGSSEFTACPSCLWGSCVALLIDCWSLSRDFLNRRFCLMNCSYAFISMWNWSTSDIRFRPAAFESKGMSPRSRMMVLRGVSVGQVRSIADAVLMKRVWFVIINSWPN